MRPSSPGTIELAHAGHEEPALIREPATRTRSRLGGMKAPRRGETRRHAFEVKGQRKGCKACSGGRGFRPRTRRHSGADESCRIRCEACRFARRRGVIVRGNRVSRGSAKPAPRGRRKPRTESTRTTWKASEACRAELISTCKEAAARTARMFPSARATGAFAAAAPSAAPGGSSPRTRRRISRAAWVLHIARRTHEKRMPVRPRTSARGSSRAAAPRR